MNLSNPMNQEQAICDFCKESKPVKRYYVRVKNKHFDDNKQGRYSNYFSYCKDCGIDYHAISEARADLKREMMEKIKYKRHGVYCSGYLPYGALKKLKGMMPDLCDCGAKEINKFLSDIKHSLDNIN